MSQPMHRAQILLYPEQHAALREIARQETRSISEVVREILAEYLAERSTRERLARELQAIEALGQIRERAEGRYGVYQGDLLAEVRAERDAQIEAVQRGEAES